ncbi:MAG: phage Gp37/Gp68 family protein, partial [Candidatus Zixiibacteriota bacterium]
MAAITSIEWTDSTWNPITGCTKVSPGCRHCYAEKMALRLKAMGQDNYKNGFKLALHERILEQPLKCKKPQNIFVNSMSDLFHENVPFSFINSIFDVMNRAYWHHFQILTKRSERLLDLNEKLNWTKNIWMGVSVENRQFAYRINHLRKTNTFIKFVSFEPLLGPVGSVNLNGIDWVIVGG